VETVLSVKWNRNISYVCYWLGEKEVGYTIQLGYRALGEDHHSPLRESFRFLWNLKVLETVKVFGWRALLDRLSSRVNLERRGVGVR